MMDGMGHLLVSGDVLIGTNFRVTTNEVTQFAFSCYLLREW